VSASEQTALPEKLVAYALSLVAGASSSEKNNELRWETAFVLALQDLDPDDLELLRRIDQGWEVTRHPLLDPPGTFSEAQLRQLVGDSSMLPMEIAVLQRHGLIGGQTAGGGPGILGTEAYTVWRVSEFGKGFLRRLSEVGRLLSANEQPDRS
jgi:hypothetical protein